MLILADYLLEFAHIAIIIFNLFGWIFRKTRRANLILILITALSWFGLGWFYGFGYCFVTDLHWSVKEQLGYTDLPYSYIKYIIDRVFSCNINPAAADILTGASFLTAAVFSIVLNTYDALKRK